MVPSVIGRLQRPGTDADDAALEQWEAAVHATPDDGWSSPTNVDMKRVFFPSHLMTARERYRLRQRMRQQQRRIHQRERDYTLWEEMRQISYDAHGLQSYEVAAFLQRSVRTAQRWLARMGVKRRYAHLNCRERIVPKRYFA